MKKMLFKTILLVAFFLGVMNANAQWSSDPTVNTAICTSVGNQMNPNIVSDGSGGSIITWKDYRTNTNYDIYAQRINSLGVVQWTTNGVAICTAAYEQSVPTIVADGSGGAIITWADKRSNTNFDIYAQRINSLGVEQWTTNGVAICTATYNQEAQTIVADGSGGAIISWVDRRSNTNYDIYTQRINASGAVQWTADGVAISTATNGQYTPVIVSDGSGGAIIAYKDIDLDGNGKAYAQRINASGVVQWTDGVALCTASNDQSSIIIVSDGSGGAIITWQDYRSGTKADIYAQRINALGALQWTTTGAAISTAAVGQADPRIASDNSGGAIITWLDNRLGFEYFANIYVQHVNASGVVQWIANGVAISTTSDDKTSQTIISDGSGGAIISWQGYSSQGDIYAQRINASGVVQWTANGVAISTATGNKTVPVLVSDGIGGAIITWQDGRQSNFDIYAQYLYATGTLSYCSSPTIISQPASSITSTTATANGNITATNCINPTTRGNIWYAYTNTDKTIGASGVTNVSETGSFGTGAFTSSLTGLAVNTHYNAIAHATNTYGTGYSDRVDFWTLANVPDAPTVNNPTSTTLDVAVNVNGNPATTEFAIYETSTLMYLQADGTFGALAVWQNTVDWGTLTVTGLTTGSTYTFKVKARNGDHAETAFGPATSGIPVDHPHVEWEPNTWQETRPAGDINKSWYAGALTSDGSIMFAGVLGGRLYKSTDAGVNWSDTQPLGNNNQYWSCVSLSGNGNTILAAAANVALLLSTNGGSTWNTAGIAILATSCAAVSTDGSTMLAARINGRIYKSTNSGVSFVETTPTGTAEDKGWSSVSLSATGDTMLAAVKNGRIYVSTNSGNNWIETQPAGNFDNDWRSASVSSNGLTMLAAAFNGRIYISTNGGNTWGETQPAGNNNKTWQTTSVSSDGNTMLATVYNGRMYKSVNAGASWYETAPTGTFEDKIWTSTALSSDGLSMLTGISGERIYRSTPTTPRVIFANITSSSASATGNITATNGANGISRGAIIYPYTNTDKVIDGTDVTNVSNGGNFGVGTYPVSFTVLTPNTRYNARAHATNTYGTGYSDRGDFRTFANVPAAPTVNNPTATTLDVTVNVNSNPVTTEFCIYETSTGKFIQAGGTLDASAVWQTAATWGVKTVTGLTSGVTYTFKVKARNSDNVETAYSETASGTPVAIPTVTTQAVTAMTRSAATGNGNITNMGYPLPTAYGVCWGASADPDITLSTKTNEGAASATGAFTSSITGLAQGTTYHLRAYATNATGTGYGSDVTFTTGKLIFVDLSKTSGANNGTSWADAYTSFQSGLEAALPNDEIWVAKGIYKPSKDETGDPTPEDMRTVCFKMKTKVAIYGGFAGTETAITQRTGYATGEANETILSGDMLGNDAVTGSGVSFDITNTSDNCDHVIYNKFTFVAPLTDALLDGFTVSGGNSGGFGGGMNNDFASPVVQNCTFTHNRASASGAGIYNNNPSSPVFVNCKVVYNVAVGAPGAGINNSAGTNVVLTNCVISANSLNGTPGGGIWNNGSTTTLNNSIIWGNYATSANEIFGTVTMNNCCYANNIPGDIIAGPVTTACITLNPEYVNAATGDFRIVGISPCADAGDNTKNSLTTDIRGTGFDRKLLKTDATQAGPIDMGAYEYKNGYDPAAHGPMPTASVINYIICHGGSEGSLTVSTFGGTSPYSYTWSTSPVQTSEIISGLSAGIYTVTVTDATSLVSTTSITVTEPATLSASAGVVANVRCNGDSNGSVGVTVSGGTSAYSYSWSTSPVQTAATATGLAYGTYWVTVTDAHSCTATSSTSVTQPFTLLASSSVVSNVNCYGNSTGSATVSASGGTAAYSYSWATSPVQTGATATGLSSGTYWVTVTDANSCKATASATVTQPSAALLANPSVVNNVNCYGNSTGSVTASASGGTSAYSYTWSTSPMQTGPTASGLAYGTYWVTVTDAHSCTATASATVTQPATALSASAEAVSNPICYGAATGSASALGSGGTEPYSYTWLTSPVQTNATATGISAGTYWVTVTDAHSCTATSSVNLTQPAQWWPEVPTGETTPCQNSANLYTAVAGKSNYVWVISAGGSITAGGTSTDNTVTVLWNSSGAQTVGVKYTENTSPFCAAADPSIMNVAVKDGSTPLISGSAVVTQSQVVTYSTPYVAGNTYTWNASHGNPELCFPNHNCLTLTWDFPCVIINPGYVKLTETNPLTGCSTTVTKWITITP